MVIFARHDDLSTKNTSLVLGMTMNDIAYI